MKRQFFIWQQFLLWLLAVAFGLGPAQSQAASEFVQGRVIEARQREMVEVALRGPEQPATPFEIEATAAFTGPDGVALISPQE